MTIWIEPGSTGTSITVTNVHNGYSLSKARDVTGAPWGWDGCGMPIAEVANG